MLAALVLVPALAFSAPSAPAAVSVSAAAPTPDPKDPGVRAVLRAAKKQNKIRRLTARLSESLRVPGIPSGPPVVADFAFERPMRLLVRYGSPDPKRLIVDPPEAYLYLPVVNQVLHQRLGATKAASKKAKASPDLSSEGRFASLLGDPNALASRRPKVVGEETIHPEGNDAEKALRIDFADLGGGARVTGSVWLSVPTGLPLRLRVQTEGGMSFDAELSRIRLDPELPPSLFQFVPPAGAEIVDSAFWPVE